MLTQRDETASRPGAPGRLQLSRQLAYPLYSLRFPVWQSYRVDEHVHISVLLAGFAETLHSTSSSPKPQRQRLPKQRRLRAVCSEFCTHKIKERRSSMPPTKGAKTSLCQVQQWHFASTAVPAASCAQYTLWARRLPSSAFQQRSPLPRCRGHSHPATVPKQRLPSLTAAPPPQPRRCCQHACSLAPLPSSHP